jgi:PAS domain S-box-containing protein
MVGDAFGELFRKALDHTRTAVYVGTLDVGIYANSAMVALTGRDLVQELLAKGLGVCFSGPEYELLTKACCGGDSPPAEPLQIDLRRPGSDTRRVRLAWQPLAGFPYYVVSIDDVTELTLAEQELRASEQRLRAIMDNLPFIAWLKDEAGRYLAVNQPFVVATHKEFSGDILGRLDTELWPPAIAEKVRADDLLVMQTREKIRIEDVMRLPSGDVWHETWKTPIIDEYDRVVGTAGISQIINERKRAENEQLQLLGQMARLERLESLGFLAGGIAHDFNNLLAGLFGHIERALESSQEERAIASLKQAMGALERAKRLTGQLLTFSTGGAPVKQTTDLEQLLTETVNFVLRGSNVEPIFDFEPLLMRLDCDYGQISQVVHNIVLNSVHAMPEGGHLYVGARNLEVEGGNRGGLHPGPHVEFHFKDEGHGIPLEALEHVFDLFFTTKPGGTGLGLATSHSIVRRHGGTLRVESVAGKGATFFITLPGHERRDSERRIESIPALPHRGRGRALILDDEAVLRELLFNIFEELGYEVAQAQNGAEALQLHAEALAEGRPFSVAMLDLTIPGGLGGREVMAELRMRDSSIAAIASSGYAGDPVMSDPFAFGFDACLAKPFRFVDLSRQLDFAVARRAEYRARL